MPANWMKISVAEGIGTFALTFVGVLAISGAAIGGAPEGVANLASIGLAHGLTIAVMVAALGAISGGHFNPAVTFGFVATGRMTPATGGLYWLAQLVGASIAALLLAASFGAEPVSRGTPDLGRGVGFLAGTLVEVVTTFFLVLVVFGTAVDERAPKGIFPLAIGLTVALDIMAAGPVTGAAMNPARVFGPALASGHWANHLVYWNGPLLGGGLGAAVQHYFLMEPAVEPVPAAIERGGPLPAEERGTPR